MTLDRVIIGGGLSGLLQAREAVATGESVLLLEAAPILGGAISAVTIDGSVVDAGAEAFSIATPHFLEFVERMGLGDLVEYPQGTGAHIVSSSGKYALPPGVMGIPTTLEGLADEGIISQQGVDQAYFLDSKPWPEVTTEWTVADLIRQRLGQEFVDRLVGPVLLGIQGSGPESLSASAIFGDLMKTAAVTGGVISAARTLRQSGASMGHAVATLRGGLHQVTGGLTEAILTGGGTIRTGEPVQGVRKISDGFEILIEAGSIPARNLSVATGPRAAQRLLSGFTELSEVLDSFTPTPSALVTVSVDSDQLSHAPLGSGALISWDLGLAAKATTHLSAKWGWIRESLPDNRHLVRFGFGRDGILPEGSLEEHALSAVETIYQVPREHVRAMKVTTWPDTLIQMSRTHHDRAVVAQHLARESGIDLRGSYLSGNGVNGLVRTSRQLQEEQRNGH